MTFKKIDLIKADLPDFDAIKGSFQELLSSGRVTNFGKYNREFERLSSEFLGASALTVSSGTAGLILTLQGFGCTEGAKVILPSFTFIATAQAVLYAGGIPVFSEVNDDLTMSPEDLDHLLKKHPEASFVIPVHMYGLPCRIKEIGQIVERHEKIRGKKIYTLYDAAHAFGASVDDRRVGSFGDAEVFSLSVTKALTTAEGGMIASRNQEFLERIQALRNYGFPPGTYNAMSPGLNSKMSEFHAVLGIENLKHLGTVLETRKKKALFLKRLIREKTPFDLLNHPEHVVHTYKDFTIVVPPHWKEKRDRIMESLKEKGIETRAYFYPPVHEQHFFKKFADRALPRTEDLSRRVITLPFYTSITEEEMKTMVDVLQAVSGGLS